MPRAALNSDDVKIEQQSAVSLDTLERDSEIVSANQIDADVDYLDKLKFNEEPVTIRLEPNTDPHAATRFPVWVNGKGAEMFENGQWHEVGYLPVGRAIIIKRKVLAVIAGAKVTRVETVIDESGSEQPQQEARRYTSSVHSFSVLEDRNPLGVAWLTELYRRNQ